MTVRDAFFNYVYEKSKKTDIKIVTPDLGAPSLDDFRKDYHSRYISVGISEQNLIAVSAGLVKSGARVIAYGLNPFPVTRAYDQVRNLMSSLQYPIILTALNVGTCSAQAGYTHMPIEDYSIMRCLPGIITLDVSCEEMARKSLDFALGSRDPIYIRFDKRINGTVYHKEELDFRKGYIGRGLGRIFILSYGFMVRKAYEVQKLLKEQGMEVRVIDIFSSRFDRKLLVRELESCEGIITLEDNVLTGGFGSMILEMLADVHLHKKILRRGISRYDGNILQDWEIIHRNNGLDKETLIGLVNQWRYAYD